MKVSDPNNVKIYNLSAGKSLPDWLSDRKRRALQNKDIDIRRRIELIQDFSMPGLSTSVKMSPDNQYILATGIYKPRVRCYEVNNLSMKFERCFDSEVVTFQVLSEDYSKLVFLHCDRYVEFHSGGGRYFRLRIPKFGRDMQYHSSTCDLYLVGTGFGSLLCPLRITNFAEVKQHTCIVPFLLSLQHNSPVVKVTDYSSRKDIYRLNLELGQFLNPFESESSEINKVAINPAHRLVVVGTREGRVEAWDPRIRGRVGVLDCALSAVTPDMAADVSGFPSVTALGFHGALGLSVGTATGQVLLYDLRSDKPLRVKDHLYGLPIRDVAHYQDQVLSMDSSVVKIWNRDTGTLFTSIEAGNTTQFNNLCVAPNSGLMFIANEAPKVLTYYIPSLGPAPKWCGFLDNLTEELEETVMETVYDDYKFVTKNELEDLGLSHLVGTNLLRAYMHGYFIDIRLYRKAKSVAEPFAFEEYRRRKIREKIEEERENRVQIQKLPKVNKDLALKLMDDATNEKKKKKKTGDLLADNRFKALFENPDFQVDTNAEEYRLLNPVLSRLDKSKTKELKKKFLAEQFESIEDEEEGKASSEGESMEDSSSEDDRELSKEIRKTHRIVNRERRQKEWEEQRQKEEHEEEDNKHQPKFYELKAGEEFGGIGATKKHRVNKASLEERLKQEYQNNVRVLSTGNREMTFTVKKKGVRNAVSMAKHHEERKKLMRPPPKGLARSKFFSGTKRRR